MLQVEQRPRRHVPQRVSALAERNPQNKYFLEKGDVEGCRIPDQCSLCGYRGAAFP